jgi:hypothetical protein
MKRVFLFLLCFSLTQVQAQEAKEWLSLTPIPVKLPAFSQVKNVKEQTFTENMLSNYNHVAIEQLVPDNNRTEHFFHELKWSMASTENDTVVATQQPLSLNHYAVYFSNSEWMSGTFHFQLFGNAEIYIDGIKKATISESKPNTQSIPGKWLPGKHTIIIKA